MDEMPLARGHAHRRNNSKNNNARLTYFLIFSVVMYFMHITLAGKLILHIHSLLCVSVELVHVIDIQSDVLY